MLRDREACRVLVELLVTNSSGDKLPAGVFDAVELICGPVMLAESLADADGTAAETDKVADELADSL